MKNYLMYATAVILAFGIMALAVPPKRAAAPDYRFFGPTTVTNISTIYHTLENAQGDDLWFPDASKINVQIEFDEVTDADTTSTVDVTLQATNQLDIATATWVDVWSPLAWDSDEDTLISITPIYALYRLKFVQSDTASSTIRTDWIVVQ